MFALAASLLLLLLLIPLYQRLTFFFTSVSQRLAYPYFQSGSEGLILSEVALIRQGGNIYTPLRPEQFISAPYPPLYYYLAAALDFGAGSGAVLLETGRLISLGAALLTAAGVGLFVFCSAPSISGRKLLRLASAALAGLLFLSLPAVTIWAARMRADLLMTALQVAGLALVALGAYTRRDGYIFGAIIPLALAFLTKQTALSGPAAAGVYLAFYYGRQGWRKTLAWATATALALGLPLLLLNLATAGEFYRRLFKYHNLPWRYDNFETYLRLFVQENAGLLLAGAGLLLWTLGLVWLALGRSGPGSRSGWWQRLEEAGKEIPLSLWYLAGSLVLLAGLGVAGADHNHFLPAEAAAVMATGTLLVRLQQAGRGRWLVLPVLGLGLWQAGWFSVPAARYEIEFRLRDADYQRQMSRIIAYAAAQPGPILSSEAGFYVLAGKATQYPYYYNDLFTLAALSRQGQYSEAGLLEAVRRKEFAVVLAPTDILNGEARLDVWTPALLEALKANYVRKFRDVWYIYEPKPG